MKTKTRLIYICNACGAQASKWAGQCADCGAWNTLTEEVAMGNSRGAKLAGFAGVTQDVGVTTMAEVQVLATPRLQTQLDELDRVLGGGLVPGSVVLIGGDPGIGKSTLLLQTLCYLSRDYKALYV